MEWAQGEGKEQSMSEKAHCFWKTSRCFAQRGKLMKAPCHYFLPPGVAGGQHAKDEEVQ